MLLLAILVILLVLSWVMLLVLHYTEGGSMPDKEWNEDQLAKLIDLSKDLGKLKSIRDLEAKWEERVAKNHKMSQIVNEDFEAGVKCTLRDCIADLKDIFYEPK